MQWTGHLVHSLVLIKAMFPLLQNAPLARHRPSENSLMASYALKGKEQALKVGYKACDLEERGVGNFF